MVMGYLYKHLFETYNRIPNQHLMVVNAPLIHQIKRKVMETPRTIQITDEEW
jgi:hypothetical protein